MQDAAFQDRFAIRELIDRYSDSLNRRDYQTMASLFQPDATWEAGGPYGIRLEGAAIAKSIGEMVGGFRFLIQMVQGVVVELDGDRARARTTIREVAAGAGGEPGLDNLGIYNDEVVRTPAGWRFQSRRFEPVYMDVRPLGGTVL